MRYDKLVYQREAEDWNDMATREEEMIQDGTIPDTAWARNRIQQWRNNAKLCEIIADSTELLNKGIES